MAETRVEQARRSLWAIRLEVPKEVADHHTELVLAAFEEIWDEALAAVSRGLESAKNSWGERTEPCARAIVSSLIGLQDAVPRTENPYRREETT